MHAQPGDILVCYRPSKRLPNHYRSEIARALKDAGRYKGCQNVDHLEVAMRAIIIDDKDAMALLDRLALAKFTSKNRVIKEPGHETTLEDMHRWFHYIVCSWLQEQGCSTIR